jgi:hypothetical protein
MGCYLDSIGASVILLYYTVYRCILHGKLFTPPEKEKCTSRKISRKITQHETSLERFIARRERPQSFEYRFATNLVCSRALGPNNVSSGDSALASDLTWKKRELGQGRRGI